MMKLGTSINLGSRASLATAQNDNDSSMMGRSFFKRTKMLGKSASLGSLGPGDGTTLDELELPIHIGIATGRLYHAILGNEDSSNQVGICNIGETMIRARNLQNIASQTFGKIYVDSPTMQAARSDINCVYVKHIF